jgi:hypothetical protein
MKSPIHDNTSANILIESCASEGNEPDQTSDEQDTQRKPRPQRVPLKGDQSGADWKNERM